MTHGITGQRMARKHHSFKAVKEWRATIFSRLNHTVSQSAAYRFSSYVQLWEQCRANGWKLTGELAAVPKKEINRLLRFRPNLVEVIADTVQAQQELDDIVSADVTDLERILGPVALAELVRVCHACKDYPGFGAPTVQREAAILHRKYNSKEEEWIPSLRWANWFLKGPAELVARRITGSKYSPAQVEEQDRMMGILNDELAVRVAEGLDLDFIVACDEFGAHFYPQSSWKWEHKGAKHVQSQFKLDNPNHWANHSTKVVFCERIWAWCLNRYSSKYKCSMDEAHTKLKCVLILDCWPVNLTSKFEEEIKQKCPGMDLRFIPAGATGKYQINNTHLHKPLKDSLRSSAGDWISDKIDVLLSAKSQALADGTPELEAEASRITEMNRLIGMRRLKNMAVKWLDRGVQRLLEKDEDGLSICQRGWNKHHLDEILQSEYVDAARQRQKERKEARELAAETAALAAMDEAKEKQPQERIEAGRRARAAVLDRRDGWDLVEVVAAAEEAYHLAEIPKRKARKTKGGKSRKGRKDERHRQKRTADDVEVEAIVAEAQAIKKRKTGPRGGSAPLVPEMKEFLKERRIQFGKMKGPEIKTLINAKGLLADLLAFVALRRQELAPDVETVEVATDGEETVEGGEETVEGGEDGDEDSENGVFYDSSESEDTEEDEYNSDYY
ncbi:hypothetical protein BCR33DRAFT_833705 [Rhizoclosmatium globosum]|uniref:DDE-1 domain-containing protein n=1 Tax=Rhizoclosmatium globosum TaxID=329046 RepID=A0A1Y2BSF9_9FUNG|nr:hypothetical protein BCR33DRAFT_833705 [Rhizoclosmatium globosum]|eukprot:ORY37686.1 hypothetical protein BCR33DRAFT_833705 [Rhizoclosmatium globosum]